MGFAVDGLFVVIIFFQLMSNVVVGGCYIVVESNNISRENHLISKSILCRGSHYTPFIRSSNQIYRLCLHKWVPRLSKPVAKGGKAQKVKISGQRTVTVSLELLLLYPSAKLA